MASRKRFSGKERERLFHLNGGTCHICKCKIDSRREAYEIEHEIPFALTQDDSDNNLRVAHVDCHKQKTHGPERKMLSKIDRMRLKDLGHFPKAARSIPSRLFWNPRAQA